MRLMPDIVSEARRRRRQMKVTQKQLALLARVSTPTVSHFEAGDRNIRVASALAILRVLDLA